jgi:hypothetical protein
MAPPRVMTLHSELRIRRPLARVNVRNFEDIGD